MKDRAEGVRRVVALVVLSGLLVSRLPELWRSTSQGLGHGWDTVGVAGLSATTALSLLALLALGGLLIRRAWGRWIGQGIGVYWLFLAGGRIVAFGTVRLGDVLLVGAGGLLLLSLLRSLEGGRQPAGEQVREGLRGQVVAFDVAAIPALLTASTPTVARSLGMAPVTFGLVMAALTLFVAIGALAAATHRRGGLALGALADAVALALFWGLIGQGQLGHQDLILLVPATAVACLACLVLEAPLLLSARR